MLSRHRPARGGEGGTGHLPRSKQQEHGFAPDRAADRLLSSQAFLGRCRPAIGPECERRDHPDRSRSGRDRTTRIRRRDSRHHMKFIVKMACDPGRSARTEFSRTMASGSRSWRRLLALGDAVDFGHIGRRRFRSVATKSGAPSIDQWCSPRPWRSEKVPKDWADAGEAQLPPDEGRCSKHLARGQSSTFGPVGRRRPRSCAAPARLSSLCLASAMISERATPRRI